MRTIELYPGVRSSVLGFGCAPILGSVDGDTARLALHAALDVGVTHFDVAPSYGFGEAEAWLGKELGGRRDRVVVATKFGIVATPLSRLLTPLKPLVRLVRPRKSHGSATPSQATRQKPDRFHARVPITAEGMRRSVELSLRRLRTDYVDWLLLHEPVDPLVPFGPLLLAADGLRKEGKIRAWGLAFGRDHEPMHRSVASCFDVLQFDLSPGAPDYEAVKQVRSDKPNIFFSPFRSAPTNADRAAILNKLAMDFPRAVLLCSMFNPQHIRANAKALSD